MSVICFRLMFLVQVFLFAFNVEAGNQEILFSNKPMAMLYAALSHEVPENSQVLFPADANMHDYQLTVGDLKKLQQAQTIIWFGPSVEPQLAKLRGRFADKNWQALLDKEHGWLSLQGQLILVEKLTAMLLASNAEPADVVIRRAREISEQLLSLNARYKKAFKEFSTQSFLLGHSAFDQQFKELGLTGAVVYSTGHSHGRHSLGEKEKLEIQAQIAVGDVSCAIEEPDVSFAKLQRRFSSLQTIRLEPLASSATISFEGFVLFQQKNFEQLLACFQRSQD